MRVPPGYVIARKHRIYLTPGELLAQLINTFNPAPTQADYALVR